jgi:hypothetical protein
MVEMAISDVLKLHEQLEDPWLASPDVEGDGAVAHLVLLATATEEHVDRQAVRAVRHSAQQHRNKVGMWCLTGVGAVFGTAMLMVQLAQ